MRGSLTFLGLMFLAFSYSLGAQWLPVEQITNNEVMDMLPAIEVSDSGRVFITCHEIIPNKKYDIFLFERDAAEPDWKKTNLTNTPLLSDYYTVVKCDSKENVHVFFMSRITARDNELYLHYTARINGAWQPVVWLTETKPWRAAESKPSVAIDSKDNIHVVFHDDDGKLLYLQKTNSGWQPIEKIPTAKDSINWSPAIVIDKNDNLHIIYLGGEDANYSLYYIYKPTNGPWSEPELIVPASWQPWHPHMAIAPDGTLNIVFSCDSQIQQNIGFVKGKKGKWGVPVRIVADNRWYDYPTIAVDNRGIAHVVWHGGLGGNEGPYEIYYSNNDDPKGRWNKPIQLTYNNIFEYNPVIVIDKAGFGHVVFYGFDGYDTELFYTKTAKPITKIKTLKASLPPYSEFTTHRTRELPAVDFNYIPSYATALRGKKFCISAGHGGLAYLAEYKIGATLYRESEMNLKVAEFLKEYLEKVGAIVYMCRTTDIDIPLNERPKLANEKNVDLFISIHHNSYDFYTNYVSFYYHADPDFDPIGLDVCRFLHQELAYYMNIPTRGVMSDYYSYWGAGYAELRGLKGRPGILGEGSHYYCFEEEEMLRNIDYLRREAYAYFIGLAKYFSAPKPTAVLLNPLPYSTITERRPIIKIQLDDGLADNLYKIVPSSIQMKFDNKLVLFSYDWRTGILSYQPEEDLSVDVHTIELHFTTFDKINAGNPFFSFTVVPSTLSN